MLLSTWNWIEKSFTLLCTLATIALTIQSLRTYFANEDATVVSYKDYFREDNDITPSASICITAAFEENKLKSYGNHVTLANYSDFLGGKIWDDLMLHIDYQEVTLNPRDYILGYRIFYKDTSKVTRMYRNDSTKNKNNIILPEIRLAMSGMLCFGIDFPFSQDIMATSIMLKTNIFDNGIRPSFMDPLENKRGLGIVLHYPYQIYRATWWKNFWPTRSQNSSKTYKVSFDIRGMEVVRYRDKTQQPCKDGFPNYDKDIFKEILAKQKCRPPYATAPQILCSNQTALKSIRSKLVDHWKGVNLRHLPCNGMEKLNYEVSEYDLEEADPAYIEIDFWNRDLTYKEVKMICAFDMSALVGNVGGFIGLFLGYALIMIPGVLKTIGTTMYGLCTDE